MCGDTDGQGVGRVGFAAVPGREHPDAAGQLRGHVDHVDAVGGQFGRQGGAEAGCSFDCPDGVRPAAGEAAQLPVAVTVDLDADHGERLQAVVDRDGGPGSFMGIDRDDDRGRGRGRSGGHGVLLTGPGNGGPARRADQLRVKQTSLEPLSPAVVAGAQAVRGPARRRQVFPERPRPQPRRSWLQTLISATNSTSWRPLCCRRLDKERCRS